MEDRFFKYAVIVSLALHAGLFAKLYFSPEKKFTSKMPELAYRLYALKEPPSSDALAQEIKRMVPPSTMAAGSDYKENGPLGKLASTSPVPPVGLDMADPFKSFERTPEKVKGLKVTREVVVPIMKSDKVETPAYTIYQQMVREKIREQLYVNFSRSREGEGEVYLTFVIRADGVLTQVQILEDKTRADELLKHIGLKSVQEVSPFSPFPKDLNYPELTFNIQISFRIRESEP